MKIPFIHPAERRPVAVIVILACVVTVTSLILAYYFYRRVGEDNWQTIKARTRGTEAASPDAAAAGDIVRRVARLIVLPADEEPTIATVTDPAALRDQPFFVNARKGDKVLIYSKAGKAVLYDPVADKIVEVAPVRNR